MIAHFIRWDFNQHRSLWGLLVFVTVVAGISCIAGQSGAAIYILFLVYFIFGTNGTGSTTGSGFRTQHQMSRNYFLALPVDRKKLYNIILLRGLIFFIPLLLLVLSAPIVLVVLKLPAGAVLDGLVGKSAIIRIESSLVISTGVTVLKVFAAYLMFVGYVALSYFWYANVSIRMQIKLERINSYLTARERTFSMVSDFALFILEAFFIMVLPAYLVLWKLPGFFFYMALILLFSIRKYKISRNYWLGGS